MILSVTGHRPNKLGGYGKEVNDKLVAHAEVWLANLKPEKVITGMALGWDMAIAKACTNLGIPFIAAVPFKGQECLWPQDSQLNYQDLLSKAAEVVIVSKGSYTPKKMNVRNRWMVDNAEMVLALHDGTDGGTGNCVYYASFVKRPIVNCWPVGSLPN